MPGNKANFLSYEENAMKNAVEDVRLHGTSIRKAAKKFGVPRQTLSNKVKGKSPIERKMGPAPTLTKDEEQRICQWVYDSAEAGFPITTDQLLFSIQRYLKDIKRECKFLNDENKPGKTFLRLFMKRNKDVTTRTSQNLTSSRASVTTANIREWFNKVKSKLEEKGWADILADPNRVFNCHETAFMLAPKTPKVLAKKGEKNVYQQVNADDKECLTVLVTGNAAGTLAPTTVLYPYKRVPAEISDNFPAQWGLGKTDSGWMTCEAFYEFIDDIFYPWVCSQQVDMPIILFVDGHKSHLSYQCSEFCDEHGIIMIPLYPNATHILQPMDVAVFKPLKQAWRKRVHSWRIEKISSGEGHTLKKKDFAKLLQEVMENTVTPAILGNGFRKCGLHPWDPEAPSIALSGKSSETVDNTEQILHLQRGLKFLENELPAGLLVKFQLAVKSTTRDWDGDIVHESLFKMWKSTHDTLQSTMSTNLPDFPVTSADDAPVSDNLPEFSVISADDVPVPENIPEFSVISADDVPVPENIPEFSVISADDVPVPENLPEFSVTSADGVPVPENLPEFSVTSADDVPVPENLPEFSVISADDAPANLPNSYSVVDEFPSDSTSAPPIHPLPGPSSAGTVPSPFKKHFFYQSKDMNKDTKRKHKEKLPAITFGEDYRTYLRLKMEKKENIEKQKLERANERKRKKEERDALKEKKKSERDLMKRRRSKQATKPKKFKRKLSFSSSSSDTSANVTSGDDIEDDEGEEDAVGEKKRIPPKKAVGEYIIVKYDGKFYPGLVLEVLPSQAKISAMTPSGKLWKWPLRPDVLYYEWDAVITSIEEPTKTSKTRDLYNVPEMLHYNYD